MQRLIPLLALAACLATACRPASADAPIHLQGEAQGTYYSIIYYDSLHRNLGPEAEQRLAAFDRTASLWVGQSLLRRINSNLTDTVTPLFADLWTKADSIRRYTHGAFDCRVGRLVQAWGFSFKQREELSPATLDSLTHLAQGRVWIDTTSQGTLLLRKQYPATEIDFNAIAQGYTSDLMAAWLDSLGIHNYLVDIGGEVIARGHKPDGRSWTVGIERPAANRYDQPQVETAIPLDNCSVVTSGSYRKYYERNGTRYSHTIDPSTGRPVSHSLLSVSVVSRHAWYADAMATAFMVMGQDSALRFIHDHPDNDDIQAVFFISSADGRYTTHATPRFQQLINSQQK